MAVATMTKTKLKDVCDRITVGHVGLMADKYAREGVPFLRSQNITPFRLNLDDIKFVPRDFHESLVKSALSPGDVAVVRTGYPGTACVIPQSLPESNCADLVVITPSKKVNPYYLAAIFNSAWGKASVAGNLVGVAQQHFNVGAAKEMELALPSRATQDRIAGILSAYDELIENNQRRIKILEEMARSLYREWFIHFRFPSGNEPSPDATRHPLPLGEGQGEGRVKLVASPLGPIPQGWEVVPIDDVCELVTDGSHSSPKSVEQGLPMASSKDMHEWGLSLEACRHISRQDFDQLVRNGCKPKKNDVLITKDGANYLKHIFVVREEQELVLLSSIAILRPNERINPHLLTAILSAPENKDRLKNYVTGAAIPRIILSDFKQFKIVLPSQEIQDAWAKIGEPITQLCWRLIDQITNLRRTRDRLLPRLLSGQVSLDVGNG